MVIIEGVVFGAEWFLDVVYSETLDFKFLLKPKDSDVPCFVEEGPSRLLIGGALGEDARHALFKLDSDEVLEYQVFIKADRVSPFDLAASWRAYQENFRPSAVRGIPDVSINSAPQTGGEVRKAKLPVYFLFFSMLSITENSGLFDFHYATVI